MRVSALYEYPLKSAAARGCEQLDVEARGSRHDRRWMLVDPDGRFVSGRELGALVRLHAEPLAHGLRLHWADESIEVTTPAALPATAVSVWKDRFDAAPADAQSNAWLSHRLGQTLRLVHMGESNRRAVDPAFARDGDEVSFADGFPYLLISQSALDQLNAKLPQPLPMTRFRPNLVVGGCAPHAEDHWRRIRIGSVEFEVVKPCVRCVFTTVDPGSGERDPDQQPLASLKHYRRSAAGITFGVNLIARGRGRIRVDDPVELLDGN